MEVVQDHYEQRGWSCCDVSARMPYDFEMTLTDEELHVEVKGTTSQGLAVNLTMGEVAHARNFPRCSLAVVNSIQISYDALGRIIATGGTLNLFDPWQIVEDRLMATDYRYDLSDHPVA